MARYKGKDGAVSVGAAVLGEIESFDLEMTVNELDANVMGNDWTRVCAGQKSASGSISVQRDINDPGQSALVLGDDVALTLYTEGNTTGLTEITGTFLVTSVGVSTSVGDIVKTSYNVRNNGSVLIGAV